MAKPKRSGFTRSQWFYVVAPSIAGAVAAWAGRKELAFPTPLLYFLGGGVALSLLVAFLIRCGDEL